MSLVSSSPRCRPRLRVSSFRDYLDVRRSQVVGRSGCEDGCPIARWLSSLLNVPCEVSCDGYRPRNSSFVYPLPTWAQTFIRAIDFTCPLDELTGEQALTFLDSHCSEALGNGQARPYSLLIPFNDAQQVGPIGGKLL